MLGRNLLGSGTLTFFRVSTEICYDYVIVAVFHAGTEFCCCSGGIVYFVRVSTDLTQLTAYQSLGRCVLLSTWDSHIVRHLKTCAAHPYVY